MAKNKSTLDPFMKEKDEDIERLKNIQLDLHKDFIEVVEKSRGTKLKKDMGIELFSGEFWSGRKAKELGLIDGIGNADQILKEKFGDDVIIKKFEKAKGWLARKLSSESSTEKRAAKFGFATLYEYIEDKLLKKQADESVCKETGLESNNSKDRKSVV